MIGCNAKESILHIIRCRKVKPYWDLVFIFIKDVLGEGPLTHRDTAIIFNMKTPTELLAEPIRAFLRHAYGCFYDAFSKVDLLKKLFTPTLVFHQTLLSFRSAVLRYGYTLRLHYIRKRFSTRAQEKDAA